MVPHGRQNTLAGYCRAKCDWDGQDVTDMGRSEMEQAIAADLAARHGPLIGGADLWRSLGYPSAEAFRQAARRKRLPVPVFPVPQRRGKFALTFDIARWLTQIRYANYHE